MAALWRTAKQDHPRQQCVLGSVQTAKDRRPLFASAELDAALVGVAVLNVRSALPGRRGAQRAVCLRGTASDDLVVLIGVPASAAGCFTSNVTRAPNRRLDGASDRRGVSVEHGTTLSSSRSRPRVRR
jgi:hypothetical protein